MLPVVMVHLGVVLMVFNVATALDLDLCELVLGMGNFEIPDSAITASSSFDINNVGPDSARIRFEIKGGAWCPDGRIDQDSYEYLQVNLGNLKVIRIVETQGRFGGGQGQEFAQQYRLEYQREDGGKWFRYTNRYNIEVIQGNTNTYSTEMRDLDPPIIGRNIRVVPVSSHPKYICMRVEMYGCAWNDGLVSYDTYQGDRRGTEVSLLDFTYDGTIEGRTLAGGLGQLTDGIQGQSNFRLDVSSYDTKGYEWVGWRNETAHAQFIPMVFKFDAVRNFTELRIHCNNYFSKDVRVFRKARVFFSVGGVHYLGRPLEYVYMRDTLMETARPIVIELDHHVGQFIKVELYFDSKWMLISEVQFQSEYATNSYTLEVPPTTTTTRPSTSSTRAAVEYEPDEVPEVFIDQGGGPSGGRRPGKTRRPKGKHRHGNGEIPEDPDAVEDLEVSPESRDNVVYVEDDMSESVREVMEINYDDVTTPAVDLYQKSNKRLNQKKIGIIIGVLLALILMLFAVSVFVVILHRKRKMNNNHQSLKIVKTHNGTVDLSDLHNGTINSKLAPSSVYNYMTDSPASTAKDTYDLLTQRKLPDIPPASAPPVNIYSNYSTVTDISAYGTLPAPAYGALPVHSPKYSPALGGTYRPASPANGAYQPPSPQHLGGGYTSARSALQENVCSIQGVSGSNVYGVPNPDLLWQEDVNVMEIPRENITVVEKLGHGQYGEVNLCNIRTTDQGFTDDVTEGQSSISMLVAVKTLRVNAEPGARTDFYKEIKILSQLRDPNIVQVLGACTEGAPLSVVVEYMRHGDLYQFLRQHQPESPYTLRKKHHKIISYGCLVYMATQIASGMKYLEALNMVHRDLASRNCLVGSQYTIKISDFGMSRDLYSSDYYHLEGKAVLPIRWMAWETIILGKFSSRSDTWSFGVTLWEILTLGREQPYQDLSDDDVIENCNHYYRCDGLEQDLPQPMACPKEIYDLMRECWNRDDQQRPAFREIHMFLQRKNMGYSPHTDRTCSPAIMASPHVSRTAGAMESADGAGGAAEMVEAPEC